MPKRHLTVFIHVPKTAGTTFTALLRENFPDGVAVAGADRLEVSADKQVLVANVPFGLRHRLPAGTRYVTFVRDPVERMLSQYYDLQLPLPGDGSLEAALATGLLVDNLQTRMLSGATELLGPL